MESFDLSLNQVNFEEQSLTHDDDELHSFSNLVSYDSDFKEEGIGGQPIAAKRIQVGQYWCLPIAR